jgi:choice-of-anchor B domain-containing protein
MRAFKDDQHPPQNLTSMSITACAGGFAGSYPCSNVDLMAFLPLNQIGGGSGNDIWGWTDPSTGKEYALMGRSNGTSFVDISDPLNPVYLGDLSPHASNSSWRDIKVYADHAFIVSEAIQSGMQVFDLRQLRNVTSPPVTFLETAWYNGFLTAHNVVINEDSGYAYAVGTNNCSGGLHMVNIQNPTNPTSAGCYSADGYTHDAQCVTYHGPDPDHQGKEICFNSNEDTLTIVDVTNKSAPVLLSRTSYSGFHYTHQGWLTEDHVYFLVDDELDERNHFHNTRTYIWNVSDLDNPINTGFYTGTTAAIDHNQYVKAGYTYQANYRAGLRILDISDIANANLSEVAYFDTYPGSNSADFNGAWSNYPFFNSGIVVVSGIEQGLFILRPNLSSSSVPPSVNIINPAEGDTVSGSVTVQIDAADAENPAAPLTVEWNVDGGAWQLATHSTSSGFYESTWDTTTTGNGPKTLIARATDSTDSEGGDSNSVTVFNPLPAFHVDAIQVTAAHLNGPRYRGEATVTIVDAVGSPVSGVMVDGTFTGDWSGSASATTGASGQATLQTPPVKNGSNWTFCVANAAISGWTYDQGANVEGCDSTGGSTTIGTIAGRVTDSSTGLPIVGANVSTDTGPSDTTDTSGNYTISSVPTGNRTVTALSNGYASQQQQTNVSEATTSVLDFALVPETSGGSGAIKGTITDSTGAKLGDVLVMTDTGQSAITNNGGKYMIQDVSEGTRTVTASKSGYATQQQTATVIAGQTTTVDFSLSP